jgi:hypothetical protein
MKRIYILIAISFVLNISISAQQIPINISVYNTGSRFELRRAPFGSQTPQLWVHIGYEQENLVKKLVVQH